MATRRRRIRINSTAVVAARSREATTGLSAAAPAGARRATAHAADATASPTRPAAARPHTAVHRNSHNSRWDTTPPLLPHTLPAPTGRTSAPSRLPQVGPAWFLSLPVSFGFTSNGGSSGRPRRWVTPDASWLSLSSPSSRQHRRWPHSSQAWSTRSGSWVAAELAFHNLPLSPNQSGSGGIPTGDGSDDTRLLCGGALEGVLHTCAGLRRERTAFGTWAVAARRVRREASRAAR